MFFRIHASPEYFEYIRKDSDQHVTNFFSMFEITDRIKEKFNWKDVFNVVKDAI